MNSSSRALSFSLTFVLFSLGVAASAIVLALFGNTLFSFGAQSASDTGIVSSPRYMGCIVIDAGHGGEDGGAVGADGTLEKDLNLSVASLLYDMLKTNGIPVIMTRTEDKMLYDRYPDHGGRKKMYDLRARVDIASEIEGAVLVSIHMNAFPDKSCHGAQVYYSQNHTESYAVAGKAQSYIATYLQKENERKIKSASSNIYLLDRIECPAILIECGFLSNAEECETLSNKEYQKKLALSIFASICDYLTPQST